MAMLRKYKELLKRMFYVDPDLVGLHRAEALEERAKDILMLIASLILFFVWAAFSGCHSEQRIARKAIARMDKAETRYNVLSKVDTAGISYCNTKHPVKVGKGQVRYIKGDTITHTDTVTKVEHSVDYDTVRLTRTVTVFKYVHDTTVRTDTFENTRAIQLQAQEIIGLRQANNDITSKAQDLRTTNGKLWFAILLLVVAVLAYIIIKSPKPWLK
jgi:hypothetical protein